MNKSRPRGFDRHSRDGLGVLSAVVQAGSFVRAGEALGLTQSAVSRAVARLEYRVGVRLFRRTARAISLTDEGLRYYESIAPHLAAIADATIEAGGSSTKVHGRLRVNVDAGIGQFVLTPRLAPFLARHPDLAVEIAVRDRMGDLVRDGFDVSVRFGLPNRPHWEVGVLLMRTRIVTCASPAYVAPLRNAAAAARHRQTPMHSDAGSHDRKPFRLAICVRQEGGPRAGIRAARGE